MRWALLALWFRANSSAKFGPVHQFRLTGVNLSYSVRNLLVPGLFRPMVVWRVKTLDQVMRQFRPLRLRERQNLRA